MTNKKKTKKYAQEFKESIVALHQTGRSANSLAKEYNVSISTISKWVQQADPTNKHVLSLRERELVKENKRLTEENTILKRA
ncbi:transposase, partial [Listeria seeligeri]|uniref:transposase n=1 Tax=Listeria seeligeri TaxID=1640 RepID=UPI0022EAF107